jgi:hypothetical protein
MRTAIAVALLLVSVGCTETVTLNPTPRTGSASLKLPENPATLMLTDERQNKGNSTPCTAIQLALQQASPGETWVIVPPGAAAADISIRLVSCEADFSNATWTGITEISVDARGRPSFIARHSVGMFNLWGYKTAQDALDKSFWDAMAEVLSRL